MSKQVVSYYREEALRLRRQGTRQFHFHLQSGKQICTARRNWVEARKAAEEYDLNHDDKVDVIHLGFPDWFSPGLRNILSLMEDLPGK